MLSIIFSYNFRQFMKRTKEKTEIEIEDEERQQMFRNQITNAMRHQGFVTFKIELIYIYILLEQRSGNENVTSLASNEKFL